jgi:hypothetical protein
MNPSLVLLGGAVVVVGRWARGETLDVPAVVGVFFLAVMIAVISLGDEDIARGFAILFVLAVTYTYGPDIAKAVERATT